jgi:hydrogenase-4 membrane subunit HyfE
MSITNYFSNPYVFGISIAILTAAITFAYQYTVAPHEMDANKKSFFKTLAAGIVSAIMLTYVVHRPQPVSSEPFLPENQPSSLTG